MQNNIAIILVSPQKGENIGFAARAMLNFGLSDLRIVSPRDGWPSESANATAVKAVSILEKAKIHHKFRDAIADLYYVYVTTARNRDLNKRVISSRDISSDINKCTASGDKKIGIVFGPERSGVDNNVVSYCNSIVQIPVSNEFGSLNLAMAVSVICYQVSQVFGNKVLLNNQKDIASQDDVNNLLFRLDAMLQKTNFYQVPEKRNAMFNNLCNIMKRIDSFTTSEVNTLIGVLHSLYEYRD